MSKRLFLYVCGEDYSALDFSRNYDTQVFYEEMALESINKKIINTDECYAEVEIKEFNGIDDNFIDFIREEFIDYDQSKATDFFEVRPL